MPVFLMKSIMPTSEFNKWVVYYNTKTPDTQEIQLARLSFMVARGLGSKDAKFDDFLVNKIHKPKSTENELGIMTNAEVKAAFGTIAKARGK